MSTPSASTHEPPVVISCRGGTPAAQLAEEVARLLAGSGEAEFVDAETVVRGEYAGRRIAAVDGCSSACGARLLHGNQRHGDAVEAHLYSPQLERQISFGIDRCIHWRHRPQLRSHDR